MNETITLTLIANAGVLVEYNGIGVLVDGIHHEKEHPFSRVSQADLMLMRRGEGVFTNLTYLLFTHEHPDHFSPLYVTELIHARSVQGIVLPSTDNASPQLTLLLNHLRKKGIAYWSLGLEPGATQRIDLTDDLVVTVIGTRHMGPQYQSIGNDCFLLSMAGKNLLFTGDGDHVREYFEKALAGVSLDVVFVNPLFYHNPHGQEIINSLFRPQNIVIYHMPFAQDDTMRFAYMVERDLQRYQRPAIQTHVFQREKQSLFLPVPIAK
ncbi:MAG: MBL fold metallo-hydrolase [Desulfobulbus sp.]